MHLYSPSRKAFFIQGVQPNIPADVVEVSDEAHRALFSAQAAGKHIVPGDNGFPAAIDPPAPSYEQAMVALRDKRDRLLNASDFTQLPDAPIGAEVRQQWLSYRAILRDLPEDYAVDPSAVIWPTPPGNQA